MELQVYMKVGLWSQHLRDTTLSMVAAFLEVFGKEVVLSGSLFFLMVLFKKYVFVYLAASPKICSPLLSTPSQTLGRSAQTVDHTF